MAGCTDARDASATPEATRRRPRQRISSKAWMGRSRAIKVAKGSRLEVRGSGKTMEATLDPEPLGSLGSRSFFAFRLEDSRLEFG